MPTIVLNRRYFKITFLADTKNTKYVFVDEINNWISTRGTYCVLGPNVDDPKEFFDVEFYSEKLLLEFKLVQGRWDSLLTYDPIILPLIRKYMPSIIASSIIGAQPMAPLVGSVFALHHNSSSGDDKKDV